MKQTKATPRYFFMGILSSLLLLAGCSQHVVPKKLSPMAAAGTARVGAPTVALRVDQNDTMRRTFRTDAGVPWTYNANQWTRHLRELVARELTAQGLSVSDASTNVIDLRVVRFGQDANTKGMTQLRNMECLVQWRLNNGATEDWRTTFRIPMFAGNPFTSRFKETLI